MSAGAPWARAIGGAALADDAVDANASSAP